MDRHLNKIATALIVFFSLTFLALLAHLLYVLCRRRLRRGGGGGEDDDSVVVVKENKEFGLLLCWRNQSRIEPKEIACRVHDDDDAEAVDEVEKWRQLCGPSRALFTIKEVEEEGIASFNTTPFHTPIASPPYYTPSPSPTRPAAVSGG